LRKVFFSQGCSQGGHISYVEFDSYPSEEMIENVVRWAYTNTNINYIGMNFHIRYCKDCAAKANKAKSQESIKKSVSAPKKKAVKH
jgi:anaerobic ribonucleoside-triphosphate reductase